MKCTYPMQAVRLSDGSIAFNLEHKNQIMRLSLPCGQCLSCRLEKVADWTTRLVHESKFHDEMMFITLTYQNDPITLIKKDVQNFMKRLRKSVYPKKIKFFACGEYGENYARPHYHIIVFGHEFPDKKHIKTTETGEKLYISDSLTNLWKRGICNFGNVTPASCRYVAGYVVKKITGARKDEYYQGRLPEFVTMSRGNRLNPENSIGRQWFDKYHNELFVDDFVIIDGKKSKIPKYYEKRMEKLYKKQLDDIKQKREFGAFIKTSSAPEEFTPQRLEAKAKCLALKLKQHKRELQ